MFVIFKSSDATNNIMAATAWTWEKKCYRAYKDSLSSNTHIRTKWVK